MSEKEEHVGPDSEGKAGEMTTVNLRINFPTPPRAVQHITFVRFSHVNSDIQMDLGIFDNQALIRAMAAPDEEAVDVHIQQCIGMSIHTFALMKSNLDELWTKMRAKGVLAQFGVDNHADR
jgi:hypothetical protein